MIGGVYNSSYVYAFGAVTEYTSPTNAYPMVKIFKLKILTIYRHLVFTRLINQMGTSSKFGSYCMLLTFKQG